MQIIKLERDDWNFFCPASGKQVFTDDGVPNTAALRGMWCGEVPDLPMHLAAEIEPLWQAYLESDEVEEGGIDVNAFLASVDQPNWVAFQITTCGMACGPVWSTNWTVFDLKNNV